MPTKGCALTSHSTPRVSGKKGDEHRMEITGAEKKKGNWLAPKMDYSQPKEPWHW